MDNTTNKADTLPGEVSDLAVRLRALSRAEHSDFSIGDEAADELLRLTRENVELRTANESVRVCRDHAPELVSDGECLVCALHRAKSERDALQERIANAPVVQWIGAYCGEDAYAKLDEPRTDTPSFALVKLP